MWRELLASRNARLYLVGVTVSAFGDSALWLALGIWVKLLTGSSSAAGLTFFAYVGGTLFGPIGGVIVDRVRRRRLLVLTNLTTMLLVLLLLFARDAAHVWLIYPVMFCYGVSSGVIMPAQTALLPAIVPDRLLGTANSAMSTVSQGFRLVTPLVGAGLLATLGLTPVVIGDAVTFGVGALCLMALRVQDPRPEPSGQHWFADAAAGIRYLWRTPALRDVTLACALGIIGFGFFETVIFTVIGDGLHRRSTFLGPYESVVGLGAIIGGVLAARLLRRLGEVRTVGFSLALAGVGFLCHLVPTVPTVLLGAALIGATLPLFSAGITTLVQRRTPSELVGRVDGGLNLAITGPQTIAIAVGAGLVAVVDYRLMLLVMALLCAPAVFLFGRRYSPAPATTPISGNLEHT